TSDEMRALFVEEIHLTEVTERAHRRADAERTRLVLRSHRHEPLLLHRLRCRTKRSCAVDSAARRRDAALREIRAVDANVPSIGRVEEAGLEDQHCDGVGLFTRRASGAPH